MEKLKTVWTALAAKYCSDAQLHEKLWTEIQNAYAGPGRHYHNFTHIAGLLQLAEEYKILLEDYDLVLYAIFYHDIVYDFKRNDNEEQSAALAVSRLKQLGLPEEKIRRCEKHILATKKHEGSSDHDTNYMVDFDLASLGESPEVFEKNAQNIRREYAHYPEKEFNEGRRKALQHFLDMDRIFKTDACYARFEAQARKNLAEALRRL